MCGQIQHLQLEFSHQIFVSVLSQYIWPHNFICNQNSLIRSLFLFFLNIWPNIAFAIRTPHQIFVSVLSRYIWPQNFICNQNSSLDRCFCSFSIFGHTLHLKLEILIRSLLCSFQILGHTYLNLEILVRYLFCSFYVYI